MPLKREADPFIKPDPDAKRVKREGGDGNFNLSSIPMAPPPTAFASSTIAPKIEGGDRKPLGPAPNFGAAPVNSRKRKFFGNSIKARRGKDLVEAHFNKGAMIVKFVVRCSMSKKWSSIDVEQEIFERLNKAKFEIQPSEDWGFLDREFNTKVDNCRISHLEGLTTSFPCTVNVRNLSTTKVENVSPYFKKEEKISQPKNERSH